MVRLKFPFVMEPINELFYMVNGVPTKVLQCGPKAASLQGDRSFKPKHMLLIIPGNPGMSGYYKDFMQSVEKHAGVERMPIWTIGHAGQDNPPVGHELRSKLPDHSDNLSLFDLNGQIQHKITFIEENIPEETHLFLFGHSIGCKMIIDVMEHFKNQGSKRKIDGYLGFPTIMKMAESPAGRAARWQLGQPGRTIVVFIAALLNLVFPTFVKRFLISLAIRDSVRNTCEISCENYARRCCIDATLDLVNPTSVNNALYLAYTELHQVRELEVDKVRRHLPHLWFYFGTGDLWCPLEYYKELVEKIPEAEERSVICVENFKHAFVLNSPVEMGQKVSDWFHDIAKLDGR